MPSENGSASPADCFRQREIKPIKTVLCRFKGYKKGEGGDAQYLGKSSKPFLLTLTHEAIHLFTSSDADDENWQSYFLDAVLLAPIPSGRPQSIRLTNSVTARRLEVESSSSLFTKVFGKKEVTNDVTAPESTSASDTSASDGMASLTIKTDGVEDSQLSKLGVALTQVLAVEVFQEKRVKISFAAQRPTTRKTEETTKTVVKSLLFPIWYPFDALNKEDWSIESYLEGHLVRDPGVHSIIIELANKKEAEALKHDIECAGKRLYEAVQFLGLGLPFRTSTNVTMLTVDVTSKKQQGDAMTRSRRHSWGHRQVRTPVLSHVIPFPGWGEKLALPDNISTALLKQQEHQGDVMRMPSISPSSASSTVIKIWLTTPLGPAVAEVTPTMILKSVNEGGAPVQARAVVHNEIETAPQFNGSSIFGEKREVEVVLQMTAQQGEALPGEDGGKGMIAGGVGLIAKPLTGIISRMRYGPTPRKDTVEEALENGVSLRRWYISLMEAELVEKTVSEKPRQDGQLTAPPVRRMLSVTGLIQWRAGEELPIPMQMLVDRHPDVVSEDIARRFIVGLENEVKAYSALSSCIEWNIQQGLADLVRQPQPHYEIIKKYYPHGVCCWSTKKNCILEIEKMGMWPKAYPQIRAAGVTDDDILRHLKFTFDYVFKVLDTRSLPHGKTVKIIDLSGLSIGAIRSDAFKFISQAGALLALNYPQRLHRAFLINAPGWWAMAWNLISPMINQKVRNQMCLFGKNDKEKLKKALLEWIDEDELPVEYGGTCDTFTLEESPLETDLAKYVAQLNVAT